MAVFNGNDDPETIDGTAEDDTINGMGGNDTIDGLDGRDTIDGGDGDDTIIIGLGNDVITGGSGADTYLVNSDSWMTGGNFADVLDFTTEDQIDLASLLFGGATAATFINNDPFSGVAGQVRYEYEGSSNTTTVQFDVDGDGFSDARLILRDVRGVRETEQDSNLLIIGKIAEGSALGEIIVGSRGDDIINGNSGNDYIYGSSGVDIVDGGPLRDFLYFRLGDNDAFGEPTAPRHIIVSPQSIVDTAGTIDTTYSSFSNLSIDLGYSPFDDIVDASNWQVGGTESLTITLGGFIGNGVDMAIGSSFDDIFVAKFGITEFDGGEGRDILQFAAEPLTTPVVVQGSTELLTISQGENFSASATNVETVAISRLTTFPIGTPGITADATQSPVPVYFFVTRGDDTFVGSDFDDLFVISSQPNALDADSFTGGAGSDTYAVIFIGAGVADKTILDFSPEDLINLSSNDGDFGVIPIVTDDFIGTNPFNGTVGEYRYEKVGGQTLIHFDFFGDGAADATLTIANGEFDLVQLAYDFGDQYLQIDAPIIGTPIGETIEGRAISDIIEGLDGVDRIISLSGNDQIDGGLDVDTSVVAGLQADFTITQISTGVFEVAGFDGTDTLTNVEFLEFDDQIVRLLPGIGQQVNFETVDLSVYQTAMENIRDFDGNTLGGDGQWLRIGSADIDGDGDVDQILVNDAIGRFATVGGSNDGLSYFDDHGWAGETRVVGIYIDPLVASGDVVAGGPNDSQTRFQNDLSIENINRVLGADDYDGDGLQEVYFALTDGTAYLHAYMHADGNIQYANYQSEQQVIDFLTENGFGPETYADWFG